MLVLRCTGIVVGRGELTDRAWVVIEPLLPVSNGRSGRWRDHRQVINGILWKLRTGAPWKTCHERHRRWSADGTWDKGPGCCAGERRPHAGGVGDQHRLHGGSGA